MSRTGYPEFSHRLTHSLLEIAPRYDRMRDLARLAEKQRATSSLVLIMLDMPLNSLKRISRNPVRAFCC